MDNDLLILQLGPKFSMDKQAASAKCRRYSFILVNHTWNLYFSLETVKNSEEIFRLHTRYLVCNYQFDNNKTLVRFSVQLLSPYWLGYTMKFQSFSKLGFGFWAQYIDWDSKRLTTVVRFAEHCQSDLWAVRAEQPATCTVHCPYQSGRNRM